VQVRYLIAINCSITELLGLAVTAAGLPVTSHTEVLTMWSVDYVNEMLSEANSSQKHYVVYSDIANLLDMRAAIWQPASSLHGATVSR